MDFFIWSTGKWLGIILATVLSFGIGFLWYGPLFGKKWQKEVGLSEAELKNANMTRIFGGAILLTFIAIVALATKIIQEATAADGAKSGAIISVGFVTTAIGINYLFARKSVALWLIDSGYFVTILVLAGIIIASMQ